MDVLNNLFVLDDPKYDRAIFDKNVQLYKDVCAKYGVTQYAETRTEDIYLTFSLHRFATSYPYNHWWLKLAADEN